MGLGTTMALNGSRSRGLPSSGQQNIHGLDGRYRCLAASVRGAAAIGPRRKPHGARPVTKSAFTSDSHYPILSDKTDDQPRHRRPGPGPDTLPGRPTHHRGIGLATHTGGIFFRGKFLECGFSRRDAARRAIEKSILRGTDFSDADLHGTPFDGGTMDQRHDLRNRVHRRVQGIKSDGDLYNDSAG